MLSQNKVDSRMGVKASSRSLIHGHSLDNECIVMAGGFVGGAKRKNAKSIMILIYLKKNFDVMFRPIGFDDNGECGK